MAPPSPVVARWELVLRLRELREQRGFDSAGFARAVGFTPANWSHVEKGRRVLTANTIGPVLDLLAVGEQERAELLALLSAGRERGWWTRSGLIGPELQRYYGMEYGADRIRSYDSLVIPGLLQTEAYARALIAADVMIRPAQIEQLVAMRMRRRKRLHGHDPVALTAVVGEATLLQQVGGQAVLCAQLEYLAGLLRTRPNVDIRVIRSRLPTARSSAGRVFICWTSPPSTCLPSAGPRAPSSADRSTIPTRCTIWRSHSCERSINPSLAQSHWR